MIKFYLIYLLGDTTSGPSGSDGNKGVLRVS